IFDRRQLALYRLEQDRATQRDHQAQQQHNGAMAQGASQSVAVAIGQGLQQAFDKGIDTSVPRLMAQHRGTHHGRQRQCHEARHQHGAGQRQRELDEQPPGSARGECQRRVHSDQGQGHGYHREADLLGAQEGGLYPGLAFFDMPEDVLQHHDGVVNDQPDSQHHGQQGQGIYREPEEIHDPERTDQRYGYGHDGNQTGAQVAQEKENDQHDQDNGLGHRVVDRIDRLLDKYGRVVGDIEFHAGRQVLVDQRDFLAGFLGQVQRVGGGLLGNAYGQAGLSVKA